MTGPGTMSFLNRPSFLVFTSFLLFSITGIPVSSTTYRGRFDQAVEKSGRILIPS